MAPSPTPLSAPLCEQPHDPMQVHLDETGPMHSVGNVTFKSVAAVAVDAEATRTSTKAFPAGQNQAAAYVLRDAVCCCFWPRTRIRWGATQKSRVAAAFSCPKLGDNPKRRLGCWRKGSGCCPGAWSVSSHSCWRRTIRCCRCRQSGVALKTRSSTGSLDAFGALIVGSFGEGR